jgi:hypothetical protein
MKNKYIFSALLFASSLTGVAQQSFGEGFDFPNFSVGNIHGQNGWQAVTSQGIPFGGCTISDDPIEMVSNPGFLKIDHDPNSPVSTGLDFFCLSPSMVTVPFEFVQGEASVSVYIGTDNDSQTPGANYAVQFDDGAHVTASVLYMNDGSIAVADKINGILLYMPTAATWNSGEYKQLNILVNLEAGTLKYNIMGEDIYTGNVLNGNTLEFFSVSYDNQPGSVAYFDSMFVFGHNEVLGTEQPELSNVKLYPVPATDVLTISGLDSLAVGSIIIYGIDGRAISNTGVLQSEGNDTLNISNLAQGTYIVAIPTTKGIIKRKFIKQ